MFSVKKFEHEHYFINYKFFRNLLSFVVKNAFIYIYIYRKNTSRPDPIFKNYIDKHQSLVERPMFSVKKFEREHYFINYKFFSNLLSFVAAKCLYIYIYIYKVKVSLVNIFLKNLIKKSIDFFHNFLYFS